MKNSILISPYFEARLKKLKKKFPFLKEEIVELINELIENPHLGTNLGANLYKIRVATKGKNSGKSGGFRVITFLIKKNVDGNEINLITIYDKSEQDTITKEALLKLIKKILA